MADIIYIFGFVGVFAVGLIPFRSWSVLKVAFGSRLNVKRGGLAALVALIVVGAILADVQILGRIFKCLTEKYCGPSLASGWTYFAMLGVVYLFFEIIIFLVRKIGCCKAIDR